MTVPDSRSFCRVVVIAPRTRVDLALPADVPVVDLLPLLLELVGERSDDGGGRHGGWRLAPVGEAELDSGRTLRSLEVLDGAALQLAPRDEDVAPPIFDDVVDAIATTIRSRRNADTLRLAAGGAAAAVTLAIAAVTLFYRVHATANLFLAAGSTLLILGIAAAVSRGPDQRAMAAAIGAGGVPFALLTGLVTVPGGYSRYGLLLGFVLALAYSAVATAALNTGVVVFTATSTASALGAAAALVAALSHTEVYKVAAGTGTVGIAAITVLPWFVVRLARLPLPLIPTTGAQLRAADTGVDVRHATERARLADEYLTGCYTGCAWSVATACTIVLLHQDRTATLFGALCLLALLMRVRGISNLAPRAAVFAAGLTAALLAGCLPVLADTTRATLYLFFAAMLAAAIAIALTVVAPRTRVTPSTARAIDLFETVLLVALLPVAVAVMDLYAVMRHL